MAPGWYVVVSADNSPYLAWQAKLFHYSCVTRAKAVPLIFVHSSSQRPLHPWFDDIARAGGVVCRVPSFARDATGAIYKPRNTPGTLRCAAELCDDPDAALVLCDADMLFTRPPAFVAQLSADRYDFLDFAEPRVQAAARRLGVDEGMLAPTAAWQQAGVPHVVPALIARDFADTWIEAIDAFPERGYVDSMYAFGIAAAALELPVAMTSHMRTNFDHDAPATADMIHYGYGDARWSKRDYLDEARAAAVWEPEVDATPGTALDEITRQLREAGEWYRERG